MLYSDPVDENMVDLPSPEELKNKIIVKAKKPNDAPYGETDTESDDDELNSSEMQSVQSDDTERTRSSKDSIFNRKSTKKKFSKTIASNQTDSLKDVSSSSLDISAKTASIKEDIELELDQHPRNDETEKNDCGFDHEYTRNNETHLTNEGKLLGKKIKQLCY